MNVVPVVYYSKRLCDLPNLISQNYFF